MAVAELSFKTQENDWFPSFSTFASPNWHNEDKKFPKLHFNSKACGFNKVIYPIQTMDFPSTATGKYFWKKNTLLYFVGSTFYN